MLHFRRKCNTFAAPSAPPCRTAESPPFSHQSDELECPVQNAQTYKVRTLQTEYQITRLCPFTASQNSGDLTITSTNDKTSASPHSYPLQKRRQFTRLTPHVSLLIIHSSLLTPRPSSHASRSAPISHMNGTTERHCPVSSMSRLTFGGSSVIPL